MQLQFGQRYADAKGICSIVAIVMRSSHTLFLDLEEGDAVSLVVFSNGKTSNHTPINLFDGERSNRSNELRMKLGVKMSNAPLAVRDPSQ